MKEATNFIVLGCWRHDNSLVGVQGFRLKFRGSEGAKRVWEVEEKAEMTVDSVREGKRSCESGEAKTEI